MVVILKRCKCEHIHTQTHRRARLVSSKYEFRHETRMSFDKHKKIWIFGCLFDRKRLPSLVSWGRVSHVWSNPVRMDDIVKAKVALIWWSHGRRDLRSSHQISYRIASNSQKDLNAIVFNCDSVAINFNKIKIDDLDCPQFPQPLQRVSSTIHHSVSLNAMFPSLKT